MNSVRYVGMDVHRDTISVAVLDGEGGLMMQAVLQTRAAAILVQCSTSRDFYNVLFDSMDDDKWKRG